MQRLGRKHVSAFVTFGTRFRGSNVRWVKYFHAKAQRGTARTARGMAGICERDGSLFFTRRYRGEQREQRAGWQESAKGMVRHFFTRSRGARGELPAGELGM